MTDNKLHPSAKAYHDQATTDHYVKGRPTLPLETIDFIKKQFNLNKDSKVVDLASGTGKFTQLLCGYGGFNDITCIEPSPEFRVASENILNEIIKETNREGVAQVKVLDGTATSIPLETGSVDCLFTVQAFHWFSNVEAFTEMTRVVKPGGAIVLLWSDMDKSNEIVDATAKIFHEKYYDGKSPQFRSYKWKEVFEEESNVKAIEQLVTLPLRCKQFKFDEPMDREKVVGRALSISYIALLSDDRKATLVKEILQVIDDHPNYKDKSTFTFPYKVELYFTIKK